METKDYFSGHSDLYATFRPTYPPELFAFIFNHVHKKESAWDCATGNGQVAEYLAAHFNKVYATDISQQQLNHAIKSENILYEVSAAEETSFSDNKFDLITVGQALHWFNFDKFYTEVKRVGKKDSILALWGYTLCSVDDDIDKLLWDFYHHTVGPYWDVARKSVEQEYRDIPFPFEQITAPMFQIKLLWSLNQFTGYLNTWSATQKYIRAHQSNPVEIISAQLKKHWRPTEVKQVIFPIFIRIGRIKK
jgi:hypothetical protein